MRQEPCPTCGQMPKRSKKANDRYWSLLREAAVHTGTDVDRLHFIAAAKFLGGEQVMLDGRPYWKPNSTSALTDRDFAIYVDQVQAWLVSEVMG